MHSRLKFEGGHGPKALLLPSGSLRPFESQDFPSREVSQQVVATVAVRSVIVKVICFGCATESC